VVDNAAGVPVLEMVGDNGAEPVNELVVILKFPEFELVIL
jgi:hypothetical protein